METGVDAAYGLPELGPAQQQIIHLSVQFRYVFWFKLVLHADDVRLLPESIADAMLAKCGDSSCGRALIFLEPDTGAN